MREYKVKTIRALDRGLEVLAHLQEVRAASLHDLYLATSLPKATLTRILATLEQRGLIWQRLADGAYLASYQAKRHKSSPKDVEKLVEVASPLLAQLGKRIKWPSVLAIPRLDHMVVAETNTAQSYFSHILESQLDFRINMLRSATGRAYLAFCSQSEREAVLKRLRISQEPGNAIARDIRRVDELLAETRRLGYGERVGDFGGNFNDPRAKVDDGRLSIAVPVIVDDDVIASINITWNRKVISTQEIVKTHLDDLKTTVQEISRQLLESA